ncbi:hypothetical protein IWX49DRAFT_618613 [Phyllosticta citricarpa]|uniref:Myb-like domain-containing protein n=1 Tax=Phyllosticta paracitricarpa TaxID=2016321 RepID=A0ABR1MYL6_9PEZI
MSDNNRNNRDNTSNTTRRSRGHLELENRPRTITISDTDAEASSHFVLRSQPLALPTYTLRYPSVAPSNFRGLFRTSEEVQAEQETEISPVPSEPRESRSRTPEPTHQMAPPLNPSPSPAVQCAYNSPGTPLEIDSDEDESEIVVDAAASTNTTTTPNTTTTTPNTTAAETRQDAATTTSSTQPPSTPADSAPARAIPPASNAANTSALTPAPTHPVTPSPSRGWSATEEAALVESTRHVVEQEDGHSYTVLVMWEMIGNRVRGVHNVQRSGSACRLWWCRFLRAKTGYDERKVKKSNLVTCKQKPYGSTKRRRGDDDDEDERGLGRMNPVRT